MRILVSGGAGFIGSYLVDRLIEKGHKVVVIDNLSTGKKENLNKKIKFYKIDIRSPKISEIFKKEEPEIVYHLAAQINVRKSIADPLFDAQVNILGSLNILEACRKFNIKKVIFTSSGGAIYGDAKIIPTKENYYPQPISPYGIAKLTIENYFKFYKETFGLSFISLRLANVYGPRQNPKGEAGVVAIFCDKMLRGEQPIINGDGKQTRDFVYIDDVSDAFILAMKKNKPGIYNIGTGKETAINTIFLKLKKLIGSSCKEIYGPGKPGEQKRSCLDYYKAKKELGWMPKVSLDEGLKKTIEWFEKI